MRLGPLDGVTAIRDGIVVDEVGVEHHVKAGRTRWDRSSPELLRRDIASLFGLSVASDGFPRSRAAVPVPRPRWYLD